MKTPYEKAIERALEKEGGSIRKAERKEIAKAKKQALTDGRSDLEAQFDTMLDQCAPDLPKPVGYRKGQSEQYKPIPGRQFQSDRVWPEQRVIVECEGRDHVKEETYWTDLEKYNLLSAGRWVLLRCTARMLTDNPDSLFNLLREVLKKEAE